MFAVRSTPFVFGGSSLRFISHLKLSIYVFFFITLSRADLSHSLGSIKERTLMISRFFSFTQFWTNMSQEVIVPCKECSLKQSNSFGPNMYPCRPPPISSSNRATKPWGFGHPSKHYPNHQRLTLANSCQPYQESCWAYRGPRPRAHTCQPEGERPMHRLMSPESGL